MARILVLNYRLEVHSRTVYSYLASQGHEIRHFALMDTIDASAPAIEAPRFHLAPPLCRPPLIRKSGLLGEQVFFTSDVSAARALLGQRPKVDLAICHGLFMAATPALLAVAKARRIPFVGQVFCRPSSYEARRSPFIKALRRRYFAACDAILAAGDVAALRQYGVPEEKVFHFDPFIDMEEMEAPLVRRADVRPELHGAIRLGFAGQLFYLKGLTELLEAFRELRQDYPKLELLLIGGSPPESGAASCESELRRRIAEWKLDGVEISGWVPRKRVRELLRSLDLFVFPSHSDTYPKAVMEAMAVGIPVALSDACGSVGPLAVDGETALVFRARDAGDLKEKLCRLIEDPALRRRLGTEGRRRLQSHTPAAACAVYEDVIHRLVRRGSARAVAREVGGACV